MKPKPDDAPAAPTAAAPTAAAPAAAAPPAIPAHVAEQLERLQAERDAAVEFAQRADAAARNAVTELDELRRAVVTDAAERGFRASSDAPADPRPMQLRALHGIVFSIRGERFRLRTGETVNAAPADLEDDGLVFGRDFEIAR